MKILKFVSVLIFICLVACSNDDEITPEVVNMSSCTDGIQNGDEIGIDCGGSCTPCDELTCATITASELPVLGMFGTNIIGSQGQDLAVLASENMSLATELAEDCQQIEVRFFREGPILEFPSTWSFDFFSNTNWNFNFDENTRIQTFTTLDNSADLNFDGFLPGTYTVESYYNGASSPNQAITLTANYENVEPLMEINRRAGISLEGSDLYIANGTEILRWDLENPELPLETILDGLTNAWSLTKSGDIIVFGELLEEGAFGPNSRISKIDLNAAMPQAELIFDETGFPAGIASRGNDIYLSDSVDVLTFKLTDVNPSLTSLNLTEPFNPTGLSIDNDNLVIGDSSSGLFLVDLSETVLSASLLTPDPELFVDDYDTVFLKGNELYYYNFGRLERMDITNPPEVEVINELSPLTRFGGIAVFNDRIIIAESPLNRIIEINTD